MVLLFQPRPQTPQPQVPLPGGLNLKDSEIRPSSRGRAFFSWRLTRNDLEGIERRENGDHGQGAVDSGQRALLWAIFDYFKKLFKPRSPPESLVNPNNSMDLQFETTGLASIAPCKRDLNSSIPETTRARILGALIQQRGFHWLHKFFVWCRASWGESLKSIGGCWETLRIPPTDKQLSLLSEDQRVRILTWLEGIPVVEPGFHVRPATKAGAGHSSYMPLPSSRVRVKDRRPVTPSSHTYLHPRTSVNDPADRRSRASSLRRSREHAIFHHTPMEYRRLTICARADCPIHRGCFKSWVDDNLSDLMSP